MTLLFVAAVLAGLYGLHRLALWMEAKGWIFYLHKKASGNALGNAVLNVQQILQPGPEHVLEIRQSRPAEQNDAGGPDKAGSKQEDPRRTGRVVMLTPGAGPSRRDPTRREGAS